MKKIFLAFITLLTIIISCNQENANPTNELVKEIGLKRGEIISCSAITEFGSLDFMTGCNENVKEDFNLALKILHSFEYDEAEKAFAKVIDKEPGCAMGYWGVAMSNFHPLWAPPTEPELVKGSKAIEIAKTLKTTEREAAYIDAIAAFYKDWDKIDHRIRCLAFEKAMEEVYAKYPDEKEAAIFYALSLNAAADPTDKTFSRQKKAGQILNGLYPGNPNHPGVAHYLIHTFDYPGLAAMGLNAARKYASVAPSSAHALHMPSHIFTRLGLWDECIASNRAAVASAQCYAEGVGINGNWDEELHCLDYLAYAYLQKGQNDSAKKQWDYLKTMKLVSPANFKVAYTFAAIPSRYVLENRLWKEAAGLSVSPVSFVWKDFPWQESIIHFSRAMGNVHTSNVTAAADELGELKRAHDTLVQQKDKYKANQVAIQIKTVEGWISMKAGKNEEGIRKMQEAADMEDKTGKHPVTPGEVIPARELLGDMLLELEKPADALKAYQDVLEKSPNRFNAVNGAATAAQRSGDKQSADMYFKKLLEISKNTNSNRSELIAAKQFVQK